MVTTIHILSTHLLPHYYLFCILVYIPVYLFIYLLAYPTYTIYRCIGVVWRW